MTLITRWFQRTFNDPQLLMLLVVLAGGAVALFLFAGALTPVIAALVIAFLLDGPANWLRRRGLSNLAATWIVFIGFLAFLAIAAFVILPPLSGQIVQFVDLLPKMVGRLRDAMLTLPDSYPGLVTESFVRDIMDSMSGELSGLGSNIVGRTLSGVRGVITATVYAILILVLLFFFLKDKRVITAWMGGFLPAHRTLLDRVRNEVVDRAGDYARGKVYEIILVGCVTYIVFYFLGLRFPALLAALTGLSVVIPYIGAAAVTLPVAFVAFFQWGLAPDFFVAVGAYLVLQALDGNLLAPLLFSEVVKLHPNAIILAILIFGSIWGLWGVFFAIPLATLTHAVIKAWRQPREDSPRLDKAAE